LCTFANISIVVTEPTYATHIFQKRNSTNWALSCTPFEYQKIELYKNRVFMKKCWCNVFRISQF